MPKIAHGVHDAVDHDGRCLETPMRAQVMIPGKPEVRDVAGIDVFQGREVGAACVTAGSHPLIGRRRGKTRGIERRGGRRRCHGSRGCDRRRRALTSAEQERSQYPGNDFHGADARMSAADFKPTRQIRAATIEHARDHSLGPLIDARPGPTDPRVSGMMIFHSRSLKISRPACCQI